VKSDSGLDRSRNVTRTAVVAVLVFAAATLRGLLFWRGAPDHPSLDLSWDPAAHVLIGLDLFDSLRHLDIVAFARKAFNEHWWPPLFGMLTIPLHAVLGRTDLPARVISLLSYAALPTMCSVAVVSHAGRSRVAAAAGIALTMVLFLASPQLVEMSRWPMLESCAAAMGLASILSFTTTDRAGWHRLAFLLAGLSLLLKYHYGFFLLVTMTAAVILSLDAAERTRLARSLIAILRKPLMTILVVLVATLLFMPSVVATRFRWIPKAEGVPWVVYATTLLAVLVVPSLRRKARTAWPTLPVIVRDFACFGLSVPGIWCLDPANARVWYRQIHLDSVPPAVPHEQVTRLVHFLTYDYVSSAAWVLPVVLAGLLAVLVRWRSAKAIPLALHGIWPIVLMIGSTYLAEARFVASLVPVVFAASVLGWTTVLAGVNGVRRSALTAALGIALVFSVLSAWSRADDFEARKSYRYQYTAAEGHFVEQATDMLSRGQPVLVILPEDVEVAQTLRLFLRMRMPEVAPADVFVMKGNQQELLGRLQRFRAGIVAFDKAWERPPSLAPSGEIPFPQGGGRALLVTTKGPAVVSMSHRAVPRH